MARLRNLTASICFIFILTGISNAQTMEEARTAVRVRDFDTAAHIYTALSERGDMQARYQLAMLYGAGNGVPRDAVRAAILMQEVAASGDAWAQYNYAQMLDNGSGVPRDAAAARNWYERSAAAGNARAALRLKDLQTGTPPAAAPAAFRRAAQRGDSATLRSLLAANAAVDAADEHGRTALMEAVGGKYAEAVKLLLSAGAATDTTDDTCDRR